MSLHYKSVLNCVPLVVTFLNKACHFSDIPKVINISLDNKIQQIFKCLYISFEVNIILNTQIGRVNVNPHHSSVLGTFFFWQCHLLMGRDSVYILMHHQKALIISFVFLEPLYTHPLTLHVSSDTPEVGGNLYVQIEPLSTLTQT